MKNIITKLILLSLFVLPLGIVSQAQAVVAPNWDVTGHFEAAMVLGGTYAHDMDLVQDGLGNVTGSGGYLAGAAIYDYSWHVTSGTVSGDNLNLTIVYDTGATGTIMHMTGTIAPNGSISGNWDDNFGGVRNGTWSTTSGAATTLGLAGSLAAEDFGVVDYDTGLGILTGYTAGFGLTDATFAGVQSVVVQLYSGATLLQTNTATAQVGIDITGSQISSPFDVFGSFDYVTDGYWTNVRSAEYGQTLIATRVLATVMLANGKIVTAENTNLTGDPGTIFPPQTSVKVTIDKFIDGTKATAQSAHNASFPMSAAWNATNIGLGVGQYDLNNSTETPYQAMTVDMDLGANYSTYEILTSNIVGATCGGENLFALAGYTTGSTYEQAANATPTMATPSFTDLQNDRYVIVWNTDCSPTEGQIGGDVVGSDGILAVTSIESIDTTAIANGTFASGWKYIFHITTPTSEQDLHMKFSNWLRTGNGGSIPVANNMRISSAQANNGGATILLTAADTYSTPALHMTSDLNAVMLGRQVEVTVEVAIPNGTPDGSYTTNYGVQTNP